MGDYILYFSYRQQKKTKTNNTLILPTNVVCVASSDTAVDTLLTKNY